MAEERVWEPVDSSERQWEPVSKAPKQVSDEQGFETLKSLGRGSLALAEGVGSLPGIIAGGVAGIGTAMAGMSPAFGKGPDIQGGLKAGQAVMESAMPSQIVQNLAKLSGQKSLEKMVEEFRNSDE